MTTENLVDAALSGLDQGELVTIPALPDKAEWDRFEAARRDMSTRLSRTNRRRAMVSRTSGSRRSGDAEIVVRTLREFPR